jgi:hypothetical protein
MTTRHRGEEDATGLEALRAHDADPERVERIRGRCLAALAAGRRPGRTPRAPVPGWRGWVEPALAVGLGALYLAGVVARALAAYR